MSRAFGDSSVGRRRKGKGWGNGQEEVLLDSDSLLSEERHAALILETLGIAKGARVQLMGRTAMPCTFDDLVNAGIGTTQLTAPRLEDEDIRAISIPRITPFICLLCNYYHFSVLRR